MESIQREQQFNDCVAGKMLSAVKASFISGRTVQAVVYGTCTSLPHAYIIDGRVKLVSPIYPMFRKNQPEPGVH